MKTSWNVADIPFGNLTSFNIVNQTNQHTKIYIYIYLYTELVITYYLYIHISCESLSFDFEYTKFDGPF